MQNPADAKSYRSWLPPSSGPASRARLLANKASSSSSKRPKLSQCRSKELKVKEETDQYGASAYQKRPFSWKRPECGVSFKGTYSSVKGSRTFFEKTKHSELPITATRRSAPTVLAVAYGLPVYRSNCMVTFFVFSKVANSVTPRQI